MGRTDRDGGRRTEPLGAAVREWLRSYEGTRLTDPRPCPDCGERSYRKHGVRERTFAVLVDGDDREEVAVESRRFWCKNCERTVSADLSPLFYDGCRYGKPVVDLCLALAAGLSPGAVADRLRSLGVQVDRETVARYADVRELPAGATEHADDDAFVERAVRRVVDGATVVGSDGPPDDGVDATPTEEHGGGDGPPSTGTGPGSATPDEEVTDGKDPGEEGIEPEEPDEEATEERADADPDVTGTPDDSTGQAAEVLELVMRRRELLGLLRDGPTPRADVVAASHRARSTADRALSELSEAGLVTRREDGYVTTHPGRLAEERYLALVDDGREPEVVELVTRRRSLLERLCDGPARKPALVEATGRSRSTVDRAVRDLADAGLVERRSEGFVATAAGRDALGDVHSVLADLRAVREASEALSPLPHDCDVPLSVVRGADVETDDARYRLFEVLSDRLADADRYRALLPRVVDSRHLRLVHSRVHRDGLAGEVVADEGVLSRLREELPYVAGELAAAEEFAFREGETPPFALLLAGASDERSEAAGGEGAAGPTTVVLATYDADVTGVLVTDADAAVEWATGRFAERAAAARPATEALRTAPATADLPRLTGDRLPARLRDQGFVRVDPEALDRRTPMEPAAAWRSGLGLAEVHAGYAVERRRDGEPFADRLLDRLEAGGSVALLGPPGSGKSTICKRVACRWAESGAGLALYRETGRGEPFEAAGTLAALVERHADPVLVVVEDAARQAADAVLDVVERFAGREDVAVLLDARTAEWHDQEGPVDARLAAVRREHVETVHVPAVDEADCERLVERVRALAGDVPPVRPADLLADVREAGGRADGDGATPGGVFLLFHRLARYVDPLADDDGSCAPTTLDEHVDRVRSDLADLGDRAVDAGVVVNVLNAAGLAVAPAYVHAVADGADRDEVRAALSRLEGEVVFAAGDGGAAYRSIHETWSVEFVARLREAEGEAAATRRFCRCLSAVLALADDPELRGRVARAVDEPGAVERVAADPEAWCEETVERLFALGRQRPKLAPLFEADAAVGLDLPAACPADTERWCRVWLGRMLLGGGYYERARRVFEGIDDADAGRDVAGARLLGLWEATYERGDYGTAEEYATATRDRAREWDRPVLRARSRAALGRIAYRRSDYRVARAHLQQALAVFDAVDERYRAAETVAVLGEVAADQGDFEDARECVRRGLAVFEDVGDRSGEADALVNLARIAWELGDYGTAREHARRSLERYRDLGDRHGEARSLGNLGILARDRGDHGAAREYYRRCREAFRTLGDRHGEAKTLLTLGVVAEDLGDYGDAGDHYRRSLELYRDLGDRHGEAASRSNLGGVARLRGDYGTAREHVRRSLAIKRDLGDRNGVASELAALAELATRRGEYPVARDYFRRSRAIFERLDNRKGLAFCLVYGAPLERERGAFGRARTRLEDAMQQFEDLGMAPHEARTLVERARVDGLTGDLDAAREHARRSLERARESGTWRTEQGARVALGLVLLSGGDLAAAADHLSEVVDGNDGLPRLLAEAHLGLGVVERRRGHLDASGRHLSAARDRQPDHPYGRARRRLERGRLARDRGNLEAATRRATAAVDAARDLPSPQLLVDGSVLGGCCARRRGDRERATGRFDRGLAVARSVGYVAGEVRALRGLGRVAGDDDRLREARDRATETGHGFQAAAATAEHAAVALDRGRHEAGRDRLATAAGQLRDVGALPEGATADGRLGGLRRLVDPVVPAVLGAGGEDLDGHLRAALDDD